MEVVQPPLGLFLWSLIIFLGFFFLLAKFAWKPILGALKEREDNIQNSLDEARKARDEMQSLTADNEALLKKAKEERNQILKEARELQEKIVNDAKADAAEESQRMLEKAREEIKAEKNAALVEIKNQVGILSVEIAEKILNRELEAKEEQNRVVDGLISDLNLN